MTKKMELEKEMENFIPFNLQRCELPENVL